MAKLYYGNGNCTIEGKGSDIMGVEIRYGGAIEIIDKTSDSFSITTREKGIIVFPNLKYWKKESLNDLFNYRGELRILSVIAADINAQKVPTTIHRVMDYTELLNTNSEDMTTKSEDLSSTYVSGRKVAKTSLKHPYINNLNTSGHDGELYLQDGKLWQGYFHIHLDDNAAMTEREHTENSQDLYYANGKPTRNTGVPYGVIEQQKRRKIQTRKRRRRRRY